MRAVHEWTVGEALAALSAGTLTASAYLQALLRQQAAWAGLNPYTAQNLDSVAAQALKSEQLPRSQAPLAGIPIVVKDNIDLEGYATTDGTPGLLHHLPRVTAPLLQIMIDHGVFVLAKTGLHELAAGGTCANLLFGSIRNPYDMRMVPGGSSGGTAAAVAARLAPAGLGTDTAGSVRAPAAHCGCVGFRPTTGRYDRTGMVPGTSRRDTMGWITRCVSDIELLDGYCGSRATPAQQTSLRGLRLGVPRQYFYDCVDPSVAPVIEAALGRLKDAGAELVEADILAVGMLTAEVGGAIRREFPRDLREYLRYSGASTTAEQVIHAIADPQLSSGFEAALRIEQQADEAYRAAVQIALPALQKAYAAYFRENRLHGLVVPTCPDPPYPIPEHPEQGGTGPLSMIRNTEPATLAGVPSLSVPAGLTGAGLPVGVQFEGPAGSDQTVLRIGRLFEELTDPLPAPRPPPSA